MKFMKVLERRDASRRGKGIAGGGFLLDHKVKKVLRDAP